MEKDERMIKLQKLRRQEGMIKKINGTNLTVLIVFLHSGSTGLQWRGG